jgi:ribose transport system substrate-binding protein
VLSACGASNSVAPASGGTETNAASGTTAPSSESPAGKATPAQAVIDHWLKPPTHITVTQPLKHAPPSGKTFVDLQCDNIQCAQFTVGEQEAARAIGWTVKVIPFQNANPATLVSAMQQALQYNPVGVSVPGLPEETWKSEIPAYKKAKVPIVLLTEGATPIEYPIIGTVGGPTTSSIEGKIIADWFIADSHAQGKALLVNVPAYPVFAAFVSTFNRTTKSACPHCQAQTLNATIPEISNNQLVPTIVSALKRNPSTKYVLTVDATFIDALPGALQSAGISGVKIAGKDADSVEQRNLLNGSESAFTGQALHYEGWSVIDLALRHLEGMKFNPTDNSVPQQLLTKQTVGTPSNSFDRPADFRQQFEHLWKK